MDDMVALAKLDSLLDECLAQPIISVCLTCGSFVGPRGLTSSFPFTQPRDLETPYSQYDSANFVPAPHDIAYIDEVLHQRHAQLINISYQLSIAQSAFWKLEALQTRLEGSASRVRLSAISHKALTSPIRRIPPEVLGEIFYRCLPTAPYVTPRDVESPMVLTQVCRHWRAVAMSTPRLWTSITLHVDLATDEGYRSMCEAWLGRAKSLPLAMRVLNDLDSPDPSTQAYIVSWLRPLLMRCHDFWWHGPALDSLLDNDDALSTVTCAVSPTPYLTRLRVTSHRGNVYAVRLPGPAPHLHAAFLQCTTHHLRSLDQIYLSWPQLTELNLHFALLDSTVLLQLLSLCTSLRFLAVSSLYADPDQLASLRTLSAGAIHHSTLRRVEMRVIRHGLDAVLDALTAPALEELDIGFCYHERDPWPHTEFVEFVKRSGSALRKLVVRQNKSVARHLVEYTTLAPGLAVTVR
ncbi:hypothetical protein F5141DRAFT_1212859 [Pisolithus sp. B1]|nr:hypothetical protein F5141DRAFT_1212859 [Pisolithus sp. B1]